MRNLLKIEISMRIEFPILFNTSDDRWHSFVLMLYSNFFERFAYYHKIVYIFNKWFTRYKAQMSLKVGGLLIDVIQKILIEIILQHLKIVLKEFGF